MAIENKFEEPTLENVEIGDLLVVINPGIPGLVSSATKGLEEITNTTSDRIESKKYSIRYGDAIVLKKNGKYLLGLNLQTDYL